MCAKKLPRASSAALEGAGIPWMLFLLLNFLSGFEHNYAWNLVWKNKFIFYLHFKKIIWIWKYLQCIRFLFAFSSFKSHNCIYCCCLFSPSDTKENRGFIPCKVPHNPLKLVILYKLKSFNNSQQWIGFSVLCVTLISPSLFWGCSWQIWILSLPPWQFWYCCCRDVLWCSFSYLQQIFRWFRFQIWQAVLFSSISSLSCSLFFYLIDLKNKGGTR